MTEKNTIFCPRELVHYYLEVKANPKINGTKNDAIFSIYGKTELSHDFFFEFSIGPFEVVDVK